MLTRDGILKANDLTRELVKVPEWGGEVYVRVLTGAEREQLEKAFDSKVNIRAYFAALACCDAEGVRIFKDEDVKELAQKSCAALITIFSAGMKLNRIGKQEAENLEKN